MISKERGEDKAEGASDVIVYKVDVPANRWVWGRVSQPGGRDAQGGRQDQWKNKKNKKSIREGEIIIKYH